MTEVSSKITGAYCMHHLEVLFPQLGNTNIGEPMPAQARTYTSHHVHPRKPVKYTHKPFQVRPRTMPTPLEVCNGFGPKAMWSVASGMPQKSMSLFKAYPSHSSIPQNLVVTSSQYLCEDCLQVLASMPTLFKLYRHTPPMR